MMSCTATGVLVLMREISWARNIYGFVSEQSSGVTIWGVFYSEELVKLIQFLADDGIHLTFCALIVLMAFLILFLRSKRIWKEAETYGRKKLYLPAEVAIAAFCLAGKLERYFRKEMNWLYDFYKWPKTDLKWNLEYAGYVLFPTVVVLVYFFLCFWYIRPLFSLGIKEYIKQYSLIYRIVQVVLRFCKRIWKYFKKQGALVMDELTLVKQEADELELKSKSTKLIKRIVLIHTAILAVCVCCWFVGLPLLVIYAFVLFRYLVKFYQKTRAEYRVLVSEVNKMVEGELTDPVAGELGMFEPIGAELDKVKQGFRKAVEEEVKSERMKTELVTNVSHDLKTPLTAILTYVELLKQEGITEEERATYITTLEKKSNRLKVLIEDLFEISRAASNTVELMQTEVDLVKLAKQAAVEHEELLTVANLTLRQNMPEEVCMVYVDGQKTYRILENLFSNICKYAMPGSRVYVRVYEKMGWYYAELKNVSAMELTVEAEELTERFVRGDAARNTEGSGLGLAIAKSLTEVQGGSFRIETDGDLFKAEVGFPKLMYEEEKV
ncbi:MAG: HAMP domain-containing histidine kinase [Lachnospiraceae bacterium]|nr:HAMP domain-containing histidine kinase [Lachnospiraceae bacterium]